MTARGKRVASNTRVGFRNRQIQNKIRAGIPQDRIQIRRDVCIDPVVLGLCLGRIEVEIDNSRNFNVFANDRGGNQALDIPPAPTTTALAVTTFTFLTRHSRSQFQLRKREKVHRNGVQQRTVKRFAMQAVWSSLASTLAFPRTSPGKSAPGAFGELNPILGGDSRNNRDKSEILTQVLLAPSATAAATTNCLQDRAKHYRYLFRIGDVICTTVFQVIEPVNLTRHFQFLFVDRIVPTLYIDAAFIAPLP